MTDDLDATGSPIETTAAAKVTTTAPGPNATQGRFIISYKWYYHKQILSYQYKLDSDLCVFSNRKIKFEPVCKDPNQPAVTTGASPIKETTTAGNSGPDSTGKPDVTSSTDKPGNTFDGFKYCMSPCEPGEKWNDKDKKCEKIPETTTKAPDTTKADVISTKSL